MDSSSCTTDRVVHSRYLQHSKGHAPSARYGVGGRSFSSIDDNLLSARRMFCWISVSVAAYSIPNSLLLNSSAARKAGSAVARIACGNGKRAHGHVVQNLKSF